MVIFLAEQLSRQECPHSQPVSMYEWSSVHIKATKSEKGCQHVKMTWLRASMFRFFFVQVLAGKISTVLPASLSMITHTERTI